MAEMNEDLLIAIERELSELAAVQPSPEFAARVRSRVQEESAPRFAWRWLALGSAVAAVILAVVVLTMKDHGATRTAPSAVRADVTLPARSVVAQLPVTASQVVPRRHPRTVRDTRTSEPEVLIDPSLAAAVRRLATERPTLPEVPPQRSLDPVSVEPLNVPEVSEFGSVRPQPDQGRR